MDVSTRTGGVWEFGRPSGFLLLRLEPPQITPSVGILRALLFFNPAQRPDCWGVHWLTFYIEDRAVTRAIPASFKTVPVQVTAHMGAACRIEVECPRVVAICSNFFQSAPYNRALAALQVVE